MYGRVSFRGRSPPLDLFSPPLIEVAVILLLRSNRFLAPPCDKKQSFRPPLVRFLNESLFGHVHAMRNNSKAIVAVPLGRILLLLRSL